MFAMVGWPLVCGGLWLGLGLRLGLGLGLGLEFGLGLVGYGQCSGNVF